MFLDKFFGDPNKKYVKKIQPVLDEINDLVDKYKQMNIGQLNGLVSHWRDELAKGKSLDDLLSYVFAATREAAKRKMGSGHFDVQMIGAYVMHQGKIAEMKTGEGKTSYAVSPAAVLNALPGKGVHIVTVNDYLSRRDAAWIGAVYHALGLSVGAIVHDAAYIYDEDYENEEFNDESLKRLKPANRKDAYLCDITYGTNNEFGFDYLRDNMVQDKEQKVQRGFNYAIIDEIDSILIDEARTPLIISSPSQGVTDKYQKFAHLIPRLKEGQDYNIDEKMRAATLTEGGIQKMEEWLGVENIYTKGGLSDVHHIEQALKAHALFQRDKDYVIKDGEIIIVDEFTGRLMYGRRYSEGLHQAIEAKEGVEIKQESVTMATITFQNLFRTYDKLAGMTGTAATEAEEFSKIYNLDVIEIPTNKPVVRQDRGDLIYKTDQAKFKAVIEDVKKRYESGQPVLLGTISIEKNELLSHMLEQNGIPHNVLNAKNHLREATIIAEAGKRHAVTLATNMAGRGVDIKLGGEGAGEKEKEKVKQLGGLYVVGTERHESRRIDNQLRGRSGRQGDSGESRFFVSLEDDLMRVFASDRIKGMMQTLRLPDDVPIEHKMISRALESAQKKVEGHNFDIRKHLLEYDNVINKHRETIYRRRVRILDVYEKLKKGKANAYPKSAKVKSDNSEEMDNFRDIIMDMVESEIEAVVSFHTQQEQEEEWNIDEIYEVVDTIFSLPLEVRLKMDDIHKTAGDKRADAAARSKLISYLIDLAYQTYDRLEEEINGHSEIEMQGNLQPIHEVEKMILLRAIDMLWVEHIDAMDHLRTGIGLRGYGQKDPLIEYKREAYQMFIQLQNNIQKQVAYSIFKISGVMQSQGQRQDNLQFKGADKSSDKASKIQDYVKSDNTSNLAKPTQQGAVSSTMVQSHSAPVEKKEKVGRNDPCPCGSGKKYKKCHGA